MPAEIPKASDPQAPGTGGGGITDEIRLLTETGSPSSLLNALDIIRDRNIGSTEFGRVMLAVNVTLLKTLYPAIRTELPLPHIDPPIAHVYSRMIRDAEKGIYTSPYRNSTDYLEHVLPFLSIYPGGKSIATESYLVAIPDLERAEKLNGNSVLAGYFIGVAYEQTGRLEDANARYKAVWEEFPECFIAALGLARVMEAQGHIQDAGHFLSDLAISYPDNNQVMRQLALTYYRSGDWRRSEAAIDEILQSDSRDREFLLMKAHILVEKGQFLQAQAPLDVYGGMDTNNRLYLFLRARVQAEAYNNRDAALNYLRAIVRNSPQANSADELWTTAAIYTARLLMESNRPQDQTEGRELLVRLIAVSVPPLDVVSLALWDAIRREAWTDARSYLARLLEERRSAQDLLAAYTVEKEQGNASAALSFARELYERDRSNDEGIIAYVSALIETGRKEEAARMIENRLNSIAGGILKSRYYFLRSRTRSNGESEMDDLISSLFEDPRNLNALIAMFEIYHNRHDEKRAVYYLRQALALAPDNLRLKRYEAEYAAAMGGFF
jgi:predicted Zn-dependent protease